MKVEEILSYELLSNLYLKEKLSDAEIAKKYHLSLGQVHRMRNKYRIAAIEQYERHPKQKLAEEEKYLIVGLLLGDGHMRLRPGKNTYPNLMIEQSVKHREYIVWLKECLKDWLADSEKDLHQNRHTTKEKIYHSYSFQTIQHPAFFELYHAFYRDGKKRLNVEWIKNNFNVISFAAWMMDDGTLTGNQKRNMIATNSFTFDEVNALRDFLLEKFSLKTWICKRTGANHVNYEIAFDKRSSIGISKMLRNIILPSMQYKLLPSETTNDTDESPKV